jgi:hypothetical protein
MVSGIAHHGGDRILGLSISTTCKAFPQLRHTNAGEGDTGVVSSSGSLCASSAWRKRVKFSRRTGAANKP